jgi:hypothetical protein
MLRVRTDAERIAAVLHDVVSDTAWTLVPITFPQRRHPEAGHA